MVVLILLGFVLFGAILWDTIGMGVVGFPKSDKEILKVLEDIKNNKSEEEILKVLETLKNNKPEEYGDDDFITSKILPMYKSKIVEETMIYTFQKPFISKYIRGFTFGWYVDGMGAVPRWYKSHSEIEKLYNELKNK
jgi:hypothetical protein